MQANVYLDILFREQNTPCFVADTDTDEIIYVNDSMKLLLGNESKIIGMRFYDVIPNEENKFLYRDEKGLTFGQYYENVIFNKKLNQQLLVSHLLIEYKDKKYNLCRYKPITTRRGSSGYDFAMKECSNIIKQDESTILSSLLALLKDFYDGERTYLYHIDYENTEIESYDSWIADTTEFVTKKISTKMNVPILFDWLETRNDAGVIEADLNHITTTPDTVEYKMLNTFNLKNIVLIGIEDSNNKLVALLGLGNRTTTNQDYRLLQTVAQYVAQRIAKKEIQDLTEIKNKDVLTGFWNRNVYSNKVDKLTTEKVKTLGVLFVNVNGLKQINSQYGYSKGDIKIKKSAELLRQFFPTKDIFRICGAEFVLFFENLTKEDFEEQILVLQNYMKENKNQLVSLGFTWTNKRYDVLSLVDDADNLMYINKQLYYHSKMNTEEEFSDSILNELLTHLNNNDFVVYLQPQFNLSTNKVSSAEALIRLFDKDTIVYPDEFIPLYEQKSIIRHIDLFVIDKVCQTLTEWIKLGKDYPISVNLSRVTLQEYGIVDTIANICDNYNVPHKLIVIEITERMGMVENDVSTILIDEFKAKGFKLSLDDFGCAYSNIVTLANISVDEVKIDKSLIDNLIDNQKNEIIVDSVINMCSTIENTYTLAEGIETQEQADMLKKLNCKYGQGYLYSKPISIEEFEKKYVLV